MERRPTLCTCLAIGLAVAAGCRILTAPPELPVDPAAGGQQVVPCPPPTPAVSPPPVPPVAGGGTPPSPPPPAAPSARTFAVFAVPAETPRDVARFQAELGRTARLVPHLMVGLGKCNSPADRAFLERVRPAVERMGVPLMVPRLALPSGTVLSLRQVNEHVWFVYLHPQGTARLAAGANAGLVAELTRELRRIKGRKSVVVLLDSPAWEEMPDAWQDLAAALARSGHNVTVVAAGTERFSWWEDGALTFVTIAPLLGPAPVPGAPPQHGRFAGVLWGHTSPAGEFSLQVIPRAAVMELRELARSEQALVRRLEASLSVTPADDHAPTTVVALTNPTDKPLEVETRWNFRRAGVDVVPEIVGFQLGPGEVFRQQFRFVNNTDRPLKSLRPQLYLTTHVPAGNAPPQQVELMAEPWCRVSGNVVRLSQAPTLDGSPAEWGADGLEIGYAEQLAGDQPTWRGPNDASAVVAAGVREDTMFIGVTVVDDLPPPSPPGHDRSGVDVWVDLGSVATPAVLHAGIRRDGRHTIGGIATPDSVRVVTAESDRGYGVEMAIPLRLFAGGRPGAVCRLDVGLVDSDPGEEGVKSLRLSGNPDAAVPRPELFAVLALNGTVPTRDEP